ncbi:MAG TPA: START domain-containing protein [Ferruginibacter sp.]|nr:START domain-containing protein [Ferruginibacter sp.]HMP21337.1 START domain-containing protein [Ferruginibacter sp.]
MFLKKFLLSTFILLSTLLVFGQKDWTLKVDKDGIKVYTKNLDNSPFKAVKSVCTIETSLSRLTAVLMDINSTADWVYATKKCVVLKTISASEVIYYSEIDAPWPVSNRDFIVRLWAEQDEKTKVVSILSENKPSYLPVYGNIVRIQHSHSQWLLHPLPNGQVRVEFELQVNPGGNIPAWLINMFATKGPYESFKKLKQQVKKPVYLSMEAPYVKD